MLALIVDELRIANWQRTKAGAKNQGRPEPISPLAKKKGIQIGGNSTMNDEEVIAYFDKLHGREGKDREPWQLKSVQHM